MKFKRTIVLTLLTVTVGSLMGFRPVKETGENAAANYFFIVISGTWTANKTAYMSGVMYYPGYSECGNKADYDFEKDAKEAWGNYLEANYNKDDIERGYITHNMQVVKYKKHSTSTYLTSKQMASDRMNDWAGEEKGDGYTIERTNFTYRCE